MSKEDKQRLLSWWESLDNKRGERAELRRLESPDDIALNPAFYRFLWQMPPWKAQCKNYRSSIWDYAMVAGAVARIKRNNKEKKFAKSLGDSVNGRPVMSELRFKQLLKSRRHEEFFRRICRGIALLNGDVHIIDLAQGILDWSYEQRVGLHSAPYNRPAVYWAMDYYGG